MQALRDFPWGLAVKNTLQYRRYKRCGFDPSKIPWRRAWKSTLVFLPGESHGQRSLVGNSSWGRKESDMPEATECAPMYMP